MYIHLYTWAWFCLYSMIRTLIHTQGGSKPQSTHRVAIGTFFVLSIMMEKLAQPSEGGGCMPTPFTISTVHHKKSFLIFPSPAGMSLTKLSLGRNHLQGADDKLGQFLNQCIWATDYHRNILRVSFKS